MDDVTIAEISKDITMIVCLYNGDTQPAEAMHAPLKDIWRFSCNHRDNSDKQMVRVHAHHEAIDIHIDSLEPRNMSKNLLTRPPLLTASVRRSKMTLQQLARERKDSAHFVQMTPLILRYVRPLYGQYIEAQDIKVLPILLQCKK